MGVSKKQIVERSKEEPSQLVGFILKLNLFDIMSSYVAKNDKNLDFYCCGLPCIKGADNVYNKKTKAVAVAGTGREALLTVLAIFNEDVLHVHPFVRELPLVLSLHHHIHICTRFRHWFSDLEDQEAAARAFLAREREIIAQVEREFMAKFEKEEISKCM
ncbi:hypothetical protein P8452_24342 [Trifolium repens]|nr:hypothetical protein P8452_24342 [Trifolium repens]